MVGQPPISESSSRKRTSREDDEANKEVANVANVKRKLIGQRSCGTKPSPLAQSSVQTSSSQPETCAPQPSSSKPSNIPFHIHSSAPSPLAGSKATVGMKKLLVLDINGVLADVINGDVLEQIKANHGKFGKRHFLLPLNTDPNVTELHKGKTYVAKRPHYDEFIRFCLEHFVVAVWSSKVSKNVNDLVNMLFGFPRPNLFFVWHQGHCENLGRTMTGKTIYSKPLKKVWLWWRYYSSNNTLLIDDSQEKTSMNPEGNVLCPPTYFYDYNSPDNSLGPDGEFRKYLKGLAKAESVPEYSKNTSFGLTR